MLSHGQSKLKSVDSSPAIIKSAIVKAPPSLTETKGFEQYDSLFMQVKELKQEQEIKYKSAECGSEGKEGAEAGIDLGAVTGIYTGAEAGEDAGAGAGRHARFGAGAESGKDYEAII